MATHSAKDLAASHPVVKNWKKGTVTGTARAGARAGAMIGGAKSAGKSLMVSKAAGSKPAAAAGYALSAGAFGAARGAVKGGALGAGVGGVRRLSGSRQRAKLGPAAPYTNTQGGARGSRKVAIAANGKERSVNKHPALPA